MGDDYCYYAKLSAVNGSIVGNGEWGGKDAADYRCRFPSALFFCGQEICRFHEYEAKYWYDARERMQRKDHKGTKHSTHGFAIFTFFFVGGIAVLLSRDETARDAITAKWYQLCSYVDDLSARHIGQDASEPLLNDYIFETAPTEGRALD